MIKTLAVIGATLSALACAAVVTAVPASADPVTGHRATGNQSSSPNSGGSAAGFSSICPVDQPLPTSVSAYGWATGASGSDYWSSYRVLAGEISPVTGSDNSVAVDVPPHSVDYTIHVTVFCVAV